MSEKNANNRYVIIESDGKSFSVKSNGILELELKEICREIIEKLGG